MKNIKNKIAIFVVSSFALFALQTSASAISGLTIGLGYHTGGAMGTGTEKKSDDSLLMPPSTFSSVFSPRIFF